MGGWISGLFAWFSTTRKNRGNNRQNNRGNGQNSWSTLKNLPNNAKKKPHNFGGPLIPRVPPNNPGNWEKNYNGSTKVRKISGIFNNEKENHKPNSGNPDNYVFPWNEKEHQLKKVLSHYTNAKRD